MHERSHVRTGGSFAALNYELDSQDSQNANVTLRSSQRSFVTASSGAAAVDTKCSVGDLSEIIKKEVCAAMRLELPSLMMKLFECNLDPIKEQLNTLQDSVTFISNQYDDFKQNMHAIVNENKSLKTECIQLREIVDNLTARLNSMEQYMREANIEIQGVPEHKSENVVSIVKQIAQVVSVKLSDTDILSCTRVAAMNKSVNRPRAIVAKLRSSRCRDEVYSAVTKFNKAHQDDKLNSSHLGIGGQKTPVYVCEHLSPVQKALHAAARTKARDLGYKFVWIRNGHIFMRKNETSRFIHVKNSQTLTSLN